MSGLVTAIPFFFPVPSPTKAPKVPRLGKRPFSLNNSPLIGEKKSLDLFAAAPRRLSASGNDGVTL